MKDTSEAIVWADEASPFTGAQVKALLDENEALRRRSNEATVDARAVAEGRTCTHDFATVEADDQAGAELVKCRACGIEQMHKLRPEACTDYDQSDDGACWSCGGTGIRVAKDDPAHHVYDCNACRGTGRKRGDGT